MPFRNRMSRMIAAQVHLLPRRAKPFYARHPWVFAGAIARVDGDPRDGDPVEVYSHGGAFIAHGLFNSQSRIRVRLYSWDHAIPVDEAFFRTRLSQAIMLRRDVLKLGGPGRACRLVFSEGDNLSGLTIDQYDRYLVVQFTSLALYARRAQIVAALNYLLEPRGIYLRTERGIGTMEGLELQDGVLAGDLPREPIVIDENGVTFEVNFQEGQKTGFYLDQRDNRRVAARYAAGRRVLDAFCYTGGFGLTARQAGAASVLAIDGSEPAIELGRRNAERNQLTEVEFVRADVFEHLETLARQREKFGLIILDPPKFARTAQAVDTALRGYRRLMALGLMLAEPGGVVVTCCCSGHITSDQLEDLAAQVATEAKRPVQLLERHGQPPDHPIALSCPETSYLKCLVKRVL